MKLDLVESLLRGYRGRLLSYERFLLEVRLTVYMCSELEKIFKLDSYLYKKIFKSYYVCEGKMKKTNIVQNITNDILSTDEYSLSGIASYTYIPEDVVYDIASGLNSNPTLETSKKIFELHISVRRKLYDEIMRKIASEYLDSA